MAIRPPQKKNSWHEWANTGIAGMALVASIAAANEGKVMGWSFPDTPKRAIAVFHMKTKMASR